MGACEESDARIILIQAATEFLRQRRDTAENENQRHLHDDLLHEYEHRMTEIAQCIPGGRNAQQDAVDLTMGRLMLDTIRRERQELNLLRASGRIGDGLHRSLERELDLSESQLG